MFPYSLFRHFLPTWTGFSALNFRLSLKTIIVCDVLQLKGGKLIFGNLPASYLSGSAGVADRGSGGSADGVSYQDLQQDMGLWESVCRIIR